MTVHFITIQHMKCRGSSVGIANDYGLERGHRSSPGRIKNFHFSVSSRPALGPTQPFMQWVPGILSLGLRQKRLEADHSSRVTTKVKKTLIYTSTPPFVFMT
jgi:hypothetical protein